MHCQLVELSTYFSIRAQFHYSLAGLVQTQNSWSMDGLGLINLV
jgi:hypothetical protein